MEHFYDGQIRRYITQTIRVFSNFVVKYGDGTLHQVPVMYGDQERQVSAIIRNNSENKVASVPRIAVYVTELKLDRNRLADATYVGKVNIRERDVVTGAYTNSQGRNYTVERIMPTPFELKMKIDIWAANTDQKLQLLEQILVLFNPSLELQTTDNYIDWTSLTVLNLNDINWSSRSVPVGTDNPIDIATITVETPIWLSPPVKVKHLGIIKKIITSFYNDGSMSQGDGYIDGLGSDPSIGGSVILSNLLTQQITTISDFGIQVYNGQAMILNPTESVIPRNPTIETGVKQGLAVNWQELFDQYPGQYVAGSTRIYLIQSTGTEIAGTVAMNPIDNTILNINWDPDTLVTNTGIDSSGFLDTDIADYNLASCYRPNSPGTFDAIINPQTYNPKRPTGNEDADLSVSTGTRFLLIEDIGHNYASKYSATTGYSLNDIVLYQDKYYQSISNTRIINIVPTDNTKWQIYNEHDGADAWKSTEGDDFVARANDIVEWTGSKWNVIFNSSQETTTMVWQTNIYTGVQYLWNGVSWVKSFEGEYRAGEWRLEL